MFIATNGRHWAVTPSEPAELQVAVHATNAKQPNEDGGQQPHGMHPPISTNWYEIGEVCHCCSSIKGVDYLTKMKLVQRTVLTLSFKIVNMYNNNYLFIYHVESTKARSPLSPPHNNSTTENVELSCIMN